MGIADRTIGFEGLGTWENDWAHDAFGRLRTSQAVTLFDSQFTANAQPLLWQTSGTGTATRR